MLRFMILQLVFDRMFVCLVFSLDFYYLILSVLSVYTLLSSTNIWHFSRPEEELVVDQFGMRRLA